MRSHVREHGPYRSGMCAFHPGELGLLVPVDDPVLVVVLIALVMLKRSLTCGRWPPRGGIEMPSSPLCLIPDGKTSVPSESAVFLQDLLIHSARLAQKAGNCDKAPTPGSKSRGTIGPTDGGEQPTCPRCSASATAPGTVEVCASNCRKGGALVLGS